MELGRSFYEVFLFIFIITGSLHGEKLSWELNGRNGSAIVGQTLGDFDFECISDVSLCTNGISIAVMVKRLEMIKSDTYRYLLSTGGESPLSRGFYVRENQGQELEVGVALESNLWFNKFNVTTGEWFGLAFTWTLAGELKMYVDGILISTTDRAETRPFVIMKYDPYEDFVVDMANSALQAEKSNFAMYELQFEDRVWSDDEVNAIHGGAEELGCTSNLPSDLTSETSETSTTCRHLCYGKSSRVAVLRGTDCWCVENMSSMNESGVVMDACTGNDIEYKIFKVSALLPLQSHFDVEVTVKPIRGVQATVNEPVMIKMVDNAIDNVTYTLYFGDGNERKTALDTIYYSWTKAGQYMLMIDAKSLKCDRVFKAVEVNVIDIPTTTPPTIVNASATQEKGTFTVSFNVATIGTKPIACSLSADDGIEEIFNITDESVVNTTVITANYSLPGFYNATVVCRNDLGADTTIVGVVVKDPSTKTENRAVNIDYSVAVRGAENLQNDITVNVSGSVTEFERGTNMVIIPQNVFFRPDTYSVEVFSGAQLLHQAIVVVEQPVVVVDIDITPKHGNTSQTYLLHSNMVGDPMFCRRQTGDGRERYSFATGSGHVVQDPYKYDNIGLFPLAVTCCNSLGCDDKHSYVSVETPIQQVRLLVTDIYNVSDKVPIQISPNIVNMAVVDRLNVNISYGDGTTEELLLTTEGNQYKEFIIEHKYEHYGIYFVQAIVSNNISGVVKSSLVQVGENLTYVDLATDTERLNLAVSSTANIMISCPTGSMRQYTLDLGDGTVFVYPNTAESTLPFGTLPQVEKTNDGKLTVTHKYTNVGYYQVSVKVKNEFGRVNSSLCPPIIVADPPSAEPPCHNPTVYFDVMSSLNTSLMEKAYSENITLNLVTLSDCSDNKTAHYTWKIARRGASDVVRPLESPCIFRNNSAQLYLEPFRLNYGEYWITGCAELGLSELYYACEAIHVRISTSDLRAAFRGGDRADVTKPDSVVVNFTTSGDPDIRPPFTDTSVFDLICYRDWNKNRLTALTSSLDAFKRESTLLLVDDGVMLYDFEDSCFGGKTENLVFKDKILTIPDHVYGSNTEYSFRLHTIKNERHSIRDQHIVIWEPVLSVDNFDGSKLDELLEKDVSGALFLISSTANMLNDLDTGTENTTQNQADQDELANKKTEMRSKMIQTLGKVAGGKAENPSQVLGCAKAITTVTSKVDEVTPESKDGAATALENVGSMTDGPMMKDQDSTQLVDMGQSIVFGASNLIPGSMSMEEEWRIRKLQEERKKTSERRKRREAGLPVPLMVDSLSETSAEECGVSAEDWAVLNNHDRKACPYIHFYFTQRLADQRREEKRQELERIKAANKVLAKKCTGATGSVGKALLSKQKDGDNVEFGSPNLEMKVLKPNKDDADGPALTSNSGGIEAPGDLGDGVGMLFTAMPNNPMPADEGKPGITSPVVSLSLVNEDGTPKTVTDSAKPFKIEIPNKNPQLPKAFGMFASIESTDKMNYHAVNISSPDQHLRLYIRPDDDQNVFRVCYNRTLQPNETYPGFCQDLPRTDAPPIDIDPAILDKWRYTATPSFEHTKENGTIKISIKLIGARVIMPITESYHNYSFLSYTMACRYYNETLEAWMDNGCELSYNSSDEKTVCYCNHLTSFGGDFVVPPNTIDFSTVWAKFNKLNENAAVFSTVISILCLYLILVVWARYKDKQDVIRWGARPLDDNLPSDSYHYQIAVHTGMRKGASTKSRISFILSGDDADTGVRELYDGERKLFNRGSVMNFILSVEQRLGKFTFLRIWHNNNGLGKFRSWYLDHIQINDLQTGEKFFFICNRWLAVEEDDGMVERIIPVAGYSDMASFTQLFNTSVKKKLTNEHIWFSIVSRPTRSSFTRVQRLSCCLSLLFLTMITNCMWFKTGKTEEKVTAVRLGPFTFTLQEVFISFMSTMIVFPVNLLMVSIFRKCKAKKNAVAQQHQQVNKSRKHRWKKISADSELWSGAQKTRSQKFKDSLKNIIRMHRNDATKYSNADDQHATRKKKKAFLFPHWFLYIAYILCFLSVIGSAFFTILYSMEWGAELANKWLATFIMSFFQSVIVVQPIKVFFLAAFISFILRKPELEDEEEFLDDTMLNVPPPGEDMRKSTVDLEKIILQRKTAAAHLRPPDMEALKQAREIRIMELKMEDIIKEMSAYMCFVFILFFISYQTRSAHSYNMGKVVRSLFTDPFADVNTHPGFYQYANDVLIPNLYPSTWYNGKPLKWRQALCINDGSFSTVRVGVPRLRQMRIKDNTCRIEPRVRGLINHCRAAYGWLDDDTGPFYEGWVRPDGKANRTALGKTVSPWVYRNSLKLKNEPYMATISTYKGGGYAVDLGLTGGDTSAIIKKLYENNWLDVRTRAVFVEFTLFNPHVNLFTAVRMTVEYMNTGSAITRTEFKVFRLFSYVGGFGVFVLIAEIIFIIFFVYFLYREVKRLKDERLLYFKNFWNLLEFSTMVGSITAIAMYILKKMMAVVAVDALHDSGSSEFVNFNAIALWDELYSFLLAILVFVATIKIMKILKFNKRIGILGSTIKQAAKDLKVFSIAFLIYFFAFCQLAYQLFGSQLETYGNFVGACESMFAFALGTFEFDDMRGAQRILGPVFFFLYIGIVYFVLMGIFLTIINDAFVMVKEHAELQSDDFQLVEFMTRRFMGMFGCLGGSDKTKNGEEESDNEEEDGESKSMSSERL